MSNTIEINGEKYCKVGESGNSSGGNREIVIVDRGWIFAGDIERNEAGLLIRNAVHVFGWKSVGFAAVVEDSSLGDIRPMTQPVKVPNDAVVFTVPVPDSWGKKSK